MDYHKREKPNQIKLSKSPVLFDKDSHTYWVYDNGIEPRQLSGVTSLLKRQLFTNKYLGIDVENAKTRGIKIHEAIELYDSIGEIEEPEVNDYIKIKKQFGLTTIANEYLISDNEYLASLIDIVLSDYSLIDIKTTSFLDKEYLSWQLSIYAYLFELQNKGLKVPHLYAIWLPLRKYGKPKLIEIERKPIEWCINLIECDKRGEQYVTPQISNNTSLIIAQEIISQIVELDKTIKECSILREGIREGLLEQMESKNVKSFKSKTLQLIYKEPTIRVGVDVDLLKSKYPDIYEECKKETKIKSSLIIKT